MDTFNQLKAGLPGSLETALLPVGKRVSTKGYNSPDDGGHDSYLISAPGVGVIGTVIGNGNIAVSLDETFDIRKYGGFDGENVSSVLQYLIDNFNEAYIPFGMTVFALGVKRGNKTKLIFDGDVLTPDGSDFYASILVNENLVFGNTGLSLTGVGSLNGNAENQTKLPQYLYFFYLCSHDNIEIKTLKNNFSPDPYLGDPAPDPHPLAPFDFGVPFGEASSPEPLYAACLHIGGGSNTVKGFDLLNWGREGVVHWFSSYSKISNFTAKNGVESNDPYYVPVDFGSLNIAADLVVGSKVHVDDTHRAGGKPWLIYESLLAGTTNLTLEDFSDGGSWTLVDRDITFDYGYTAARCSGAGGHHNTISHGSASYCRASSFSADSLATGMYKLHSYHNSFQVGINFGHDGSPASGSVGSGLTSINAGWADQSGTGSSYGISVGAGSKNVAISAFTIVNAARAGINVSNSGDDVTLSDGSVRHCQFQGINSFASNILVSNVRSVDNGLDFKAAGGGTITLSNCEDSTGTILNHQISEDTVARTFELQSRDAKLFRGLRGLFGVISSLGTPVPLATITFDNLTSNDNMLVTCTYTERNLGSGVGVNQYTISQTVLVSGSGGARTFTVQHTPYKQGRNFKYTYSAGVMKIFLVDAGLVEVDALANSNGLLIEALSVSNSSMKIDIG